MKSKKQLIGWEKWQDPFVQNNNNRLSNYIDGDTDTDTYTDGYKDGDSGHAPQNKPPHNAVPVIITPVGIIPIGEGMTPGQNFNFWIGHTTFRLTLNIQDIIESVDGVEILDIHTPYRMRLGIGKMFTSQNVKYNISQKISEYLNSIKKITNDIKSQIPPS